MVLAVFARRATVGLQGLLRAEMYATKAVGAFLPNSCHPLIGLHILNQSYVADWADFFARTASDALLSVHIGHYGYTVGAGVTAFARQVALRRDGADKERRHFDSAFFGYRLAA